MRPLVLVTAAAVAAIACQCGPVPSEPVGSVELRLIHRSGTNMAAGQPRTFTNDLGYEVTVERGWFVVSAVELRACPESSRRPSLWQRLSPIGTAWAHGESTPTRLSNPTVDDLLRADDAPKTLATLAPPVGAYCTVAVTFGPADADARDLPTGVELVEKMLRVEGTWRPPGGGTASPFVLETGLSAVTSVSDAQPISLPQEGSTSTATIVVAYNRWFDGIDLSATDETAKVRALVENVKTSTSLRVVNE